MSLENKGNPLFHGNLAPEISPVGENILEHKPDFLKHEMPGKLHAETIEDESVLHGKHAINKYKMRENIAHDVEDVESKIRKLKFGLKESGKSAYKRFGKDITDSFHGNPTEFSEWKIKKEITQGKQQLEHDRRNMQFDEIKKDKQRINILHWLLGKKPK